MDYNVRKVDQYLDALVATRSLTPGGKEWLVAALDPFHDTDVNCTGYPDVNLSASVVQLVKQTAQIACPASISSGTWDCHIMQLPWLNAVEMDLDALTTNLLQQPATTAGTLPVGGVVAVSVATGSPTPLSSLTSSFTTTVPLPSSYYAGASRLIAMGFEVVNTTSDLNVQGQAIAYRSPIANGQNSASYQIVNSTTGAVGGVISTYSVNPPPTTPAAAMLLTGSRQWHAREGGYVVAAFNSDENPATGEQFIYPLVEADEYVGTVDTTAIVPIIDTHTVGSNSALYGPRLMANAPLDQSGLYMTGLSLATTLAVSVNYYVERFPGIGEGDLVVLAKPSPPFDPLALELYGVALNNMPPGVMVRENGLGEWFSDAISGVSGFLGNALGMIPTPITQGLALGAKAVSSVAKAFSSSPAKPALVSPPSSNIEVATAGRTFLAPATQVQNYEPRIPNYGHQINLNAAAIAKLRRRLQVDEQKLKKPQNRKRKRRS